MLPGINDKGNCSGCRACEETCPHFAISMEEDAHGFVYPKLLKNKCVHCNLCERVCPNLNPPSTINETREAVASIHKDEQIKFLSSSGGAFSAICEAMERKHPGTLFCGVRWDGFDARHDMVSFDGLEKFRKSKYIMADTAGIFKQVKKVLKAGESVVFSGSPCQCAALRNYVGSTPNLLIVDIVCHGAPSSKLFKMHIRNLDDDSMKVTKYSFRDKSTINGIISSRSAQVRYNNGTKKHFEINEDAYLQLYYSRLAYRPSCGQCRFAAPNRVSDITICDAHHINEIYPKLSVEKGASVILFHSLKALSFKSDIEGLMETYPIPYDWVVKHNEQLRRPTTIHPKTDDFYKSIDGGASFESAVQRSLKDNIWSKLKRKIKKACLCVFILQEG